MPTFSIQQTAPIDARAGLTQNISVNAPSTSSSGYAPSGSGGNSIVPSSVTNIDRLPLYLFGAGVIYFLFKKGIL